MRRLWQFSAYLVLLAVPAFAQRSTGAIRGTITDESHAVIAGAKVTVTNEGTGLTRTMPSNAAGAYSFPDLPVGNYRIDVEQTGFKAVARTKIVLNVAEVREINIELSTGPVSEVVSVEAPAVAVQTVGGDLSGLVTGQEVRELPLNGRNFLQLTLLMPGVSAPDFLNVKDKGLLGGSDLSVSGSDVTANLWTVDGVNNNDVGSNRTILVYPSVDAIEEFKIQRNSYGAEFGQAGGAQVNVVTRGGTNDFHGSGFFFGRRDALDAKNYFLQCPPTCPELPKDKLQRNDFGWTFGGPIIKDKLQFFASEEFNRETRGVTRARFVPTAQERQGDFSGPTVAGCSSPVPIDPLTGQPFPGNVIPTNRLSPGGLLFLQLYPLPNTTPGPGSCNNWVASINSPINWRQENVRLDYSISNTSHLMLRFTQDHWENNAPDLEENLWGDDAFPAVTSNWSQPGYSVVAQLTQNIGSRAVNTLQFSYSANKIDVSRGGTNPGLNGQLNAAIPALFPDSIKEYGADRGHPIFFGASGYDTLQNEAPFHNNQDLFIVKDDYSAVFGKHNIKIGALGSYNKKNEDIFDQGSAESPQFWGSVGLNNTGITTGNLLADFLLKDMTFGFTENSAQRQNPQRWKDLEFYAADSWKAAPRLTIDLGIRYSKLFNPYTADNRTMSFDPAHFNPALGSSPCNGLLEPPGTNWCEAAGFPGATQGPNASLFNQDNKLFAPRVGIAWDVSGNGKTAIRAGAGQFFLRERLSAGLVLAGNPPFVTVITGNRYLDSVTPPCDGCFSASNGAPNQGREVKALTPNNWQWNLSFEHEFLRNTTWELSYVGSKGTHLLRTYDANQVPPSQRLSYVQTLPTTGAQRPYPQYGDQRITFWDHGGDSTYHSLQTQILSHFGRGSQFEASYTFSRVLSNISLDSSDGGLSADTSVLDTANPRLDRGLARTNRTHVFNAALVLLLPALESKPGFVRNVFGDWEFTTIVQAASGTPFTIHTGAVPGLGGNGGGPSGTGYTANNVPNRVPGQSCAPPGGSPPEQWLNPAAFTLDGFQLGTIGNAGRGTCEGPNFRQVDMALYKNIKLSKSVKAQLRFEVFNVFNRNNFLSSPGSNFNVMSPIDATLNAPIASATTITHATIPANFGQANATRDARQAQFGVKLTF